MERVVYYRSLQLKLTIVSYIALCSFMDSDFTLECEHKGMFNEDNIIKYVCVGCIRIQYTTHYVCVCSDGCCVHRPHG